MTEIDCTHHLMETFFPSLPWAFRLLNLHLLSFPSWRISFPRGHDSLLYKCESSTWSSSHNSRKGWFLGDWGYSFVIYFSLPSKKKKRSYKLWDLSFWKMDQILPRNILFFSWCGWERNGDLNLKGIGLAVVIDVPIPDLRKKYIGLITRLFLCI